MNDISKEVIKQCRIFLKFLAIKSPADQAGLVVLSLIRSGNKCLTSTLDHSLQRCCAGILIGVQAFAVTSDTVFVDQSEAEASFASGHNQAVHWSKGVG